jgi:asparagine synthase (glutamine-hydrolysing)
MIQALAHRGPDETGVMVCDAVGLAHARLAIVDPSSAGHQPMTHPSGRWVLAFNGEIFNHLELRALLPPADYFGHSDTETLLYAIAEWGEGAISRCNGMFAFAALDRAERRLLLVRDRFGKKPLYIARHNGALWFASELKSLLAAGIPRRARRELLAHAAGNGWLHGADTPIDGVSRLAPGTVASVKLDTLETTERRWYDPANAVDPQLATELAGLSRVQLMRRVEAELRDSVHRRLMSDVPIGTMCSGGLDSSLISALACEVEPGIVAFTAALDDDPQRDERHWAERVARELGLELRTVHISASSWRRALVPAVEHYEYPLAHESSIPIAEIAALARSSGVKVLLTGEGADELFGGYSFLHRELYRQFLPRRAQLARVIDRLNRVGLPGLPAAAVDAARRGQQRPCLEPAVQSESFERAVARRAESAYSHHAGARHDLEAALLSELSGGVLPLLLNRMDKNAMQASVEARVPFLDPQLVSLVLNLPLEHRVGPEPKGILRDVAAAHLSRRVARRPKQIGLECDVRRYLLAGARPEFLEQGSLRETLGIERERWETTVRQCGESHALSLWTAEIWCRLTLEGEPRAAVESELWSDPE